MEAYFCESDSDAGSSDNEDLEHARGSNEDKQCRICLKDGGHQLIAPCHCAGTSKWVHRSCLDRWRASNVNPKAFTHCSECKFEYVLKLNKATAESNAQFESRRARGLRRLSCGFVLCFLLVQIWLLSLALWIRMIDQQEVLVKFFNLPQVTDSHPPGDCTFLEAMHHHKETYYLSSLLVSLFLLGVWGTCAGLITCCRGGGPTSRSVSNNNSPGSLAANCCDCSFYPSYGSPYGSPYGNDGNCCDVCCIECCNDCSATCCNCRGGGGGEGCPCSGCINLDALGCGGGGGGGGDGCGEGILIVLLVVVLFFIVAGLFIALVALVGVMTKGAERFAQLQERKELAREYLVMDLAESKRPEQLLMNEDIRKELASDMSTVYRET